MVNNDDGTKTEIESKKVNGDDVKIKITFDDKKTKLFQEIITNKIAQEGNSKIKTEISEKIEFDNDGNQSNVLNFEKKFKDDVLKSIMKKEENKMTTIFFSDDGSIVEEKIEAKKEGEEEFKIISHKALNQGLNSYSLNGDENIGVSYFVENSKNGKVIYNALDGSLVVYKDDVTYSESDNIINYGEESFRVFMKDGKIIISSNKDNSFEIYSDVNLMVDKNSGEIFANSIEDKNKINIFGSEINDIIKTKDLLSNVDSINLANDNGLVYKIHGSKNKKMLGIFEKEINKTVTLSSVGELKSIEVSENDKIKDYLSW